MAGGGIYLEWERGPRGKTLLASRTLKEREEKKKKNEDGEGARQRRQPENTEGP